MPGCEKLDSCIQCGTCSGICPLSIYMDMPPRRVINLVRAGFKKEVMQSNTVWLCSSCYACTVECPREIKVTDVMYAIKQQAIREGAFPSRFPMPVLAREFFKMVRGHGRINEIWLVAWLLIYTNVFKGLGMTRLGFELFKRGRMSLLHDNIKGRDQVQKILDYEPANGKEGSR